MRADSGCSGSSRPRGPPRRLEAHVAAEAAAGQRWLGHGSRLSMRGSGRLGRKPNIVLLITDQQRQPRHWPDEAGWLRRLMPNDTELARRGSRSATASANGDVLAEPGDAVHRRLSRRARGDADPDPGRPAPEPSPRAGHDPNAGRAASQRRGPPRAAAEAVRPRAVSPRPELRQREGAPTRDPEPAEPPARGGLRGRLQGQVAPHPPGGGRAARACSAAGCPPTPTCSPATMASPTGRSRTPARTRRLRISAAATQARVRAGTRSTSARSSAGSAARICPSRSASSSRW